VNIFSHLIGAAIFFALPITLYHELRWRYPSASSSDVAVFGTYIFGVAACFTFSVIFHTTMSHSKRWYMFGIKLDFQGVILLMWSATAPIVYYTFFDQPMLEIVYWSLVS
jgi:adiponectin receptor